MTLLILLFTINLHLNLDHQVKKFLIFGKDFIKPKLAKRKVSHFMKSEVFVCVTK